MKKKFALLGMLLLVVLFVVLNIFTAGDKHVKVVDENVTLVNENGKLKAENGQLKAENGRLTALNEQLTLEKTNALSFVMDSLKKQMSVFPKVLIKVEQDIDAQLGWASPQMTIELLEDKLKRKPSSEEYEKALLELYSKDMLYYSGYPDPYVKGKKVQKSEINKLVSNK